MGGTLPTRSGGVLVNEVAITPEELCRLYSAPVFRFAGMAAGPGVDVEDIAQEALIKAMLALPRFDPSRTSIEGWLWTIVVNTARDMSRRSNHRRAIWERLKSQHQPPNPADEEAIARFEWNQVKLEMARLSDRERTLIGLRFGAQLQYAEMAKATGISEGAVVMATRRALATLRARLEGRVR
jgi:RNA polymerase sigma-70 factor (ECF subfamily)